MRAPNPYTNAPRLPDGEGIDPRALLGSGDRPVELEIGPGRGGFALERLAAVPDVALLGLEIRRKWASIVDGRLAAGGYHPRGRVLADDARLALPRLLRGTLAVVYLHFPDPWWKKRHRKRLVASDSLLTEVARLLVPGGELFYQTDVAERADEFEALVLSSGLFVPHGGASPRVDENPYGARSPRERRAMADGLPIHRLRLRAAPRD